MSILDEIIQQKRREVAEQKELYPTKLLEKSLYFSSQCVSLVDYLRRTDLVGIIAEYKRRSPSKGVINEFAKIEDVSLGYMQAGASALSILTDAMYFGGSNEDLKKARRINFCPILRKDFCIDEYQVLQAKSIGADVILLLASILRDTEITYLTTLATQLGMEVLLETHTEDEIKRANNLEPSIVGVNCRNLHDFSVKTEHALDLLNGISKEKTKIAESGIQDAETVVKLKKGGYSGFLIGEAFMRESKPEAACMRLIKMVQSSGEYASPA